MGGRVLVTLGFTRDHQRVDVFDSLNCKVNLVQRWFTFTCRFMLQTYSTYVQSKSLGRQAHQFGLTITNTM